MTSGTSQIITRLLTIVLSIATARALEPREVGLLGIAVIIIAVISMICYYPEIAAVAVNGDERHEQYAFASFGLRAVLLAFILVLLSVGFPFLANFIGGKENLSGPLRQLIAILVWVPALELLAGYPRVVFQRRMELNVISTAAAIQPCIFVSLAVLFLLSGYGYVGVAWASVIGALVAAGFLWATYLWLGSIKWFGLPSILTFWETFVGSIRVFVGGFAGFLGERVDNLLVSAAIGPTSMSYYSMAWNGARTPANVFGSTIGFVLIPTLARIQDQPARVERAIRESLRHSYLLLLPLCAFMFVAAPSVVTLVLGPKWMPLVPCFRVMCVTVLTIPVLFTSGALLTGSGRAHLAGLAMLLHLVVLLAAVPPLAKGWGVVGAAFADLMAMSTATAVLFLTARRATRQTEWSLRGTLLVPGISVLVSAGLAYAVGAGFKGVTWQAIAQFAVLTTGYVLMLMLVGGKTRLDELIGLLRGIAPRVRRSRRETSAAEHQSSADMSLDRVEVRS